MGGFLPGQVTCQWDGLLSPIYRVPQVLVRGFQVGQTTPLWVDLFVLYARYLEGGREGRYRMAARSGQEVAHPAIIWVTFCCWSYISLRIGSGAGE